MYVLLLALLLSSASAIASTVESRDELDGQMWGTFDIQEELMPEVSMAAGALVASDGRILWSRNLDEQRSPASIVKVMTAILVIENLDEDETLTLSSMPVSYLESRALLRRGEIITREQLLQALLIVSGNDAAFAAAELVAGDLPSFVDMMNERAQELGMTNTQFRNASGMDDDGQFSTARDIATMSRFAMSLPEFREVVGTIEVELTTNMTSHSWTNTNILLQSYEGANGVKTGWTRAAGFSVVESAERGGLELYAVVLGTNATLARFFDARALLDFGFTHFRSQELALEGTLAGTAPVVNFLDRSVQLAVGEDKIENIFALAGPVEKSTEIHEVTSPIERGDVLGTMIFTQRGRLVAQVPLVATQDVENPFFLVQWYYNIVMAWRNVFD